MENIYSVKNIEITKKYIQIYEENIEILVENRDNGKQIQRVEKIDSGKKNKEYGKKYIDKWK